MQRFPTANASLSDGTHLTAYSKVIVEKKNPKILNRNSNLVLKNSDLKPEDLLLKTRTLFTINLSHISNETGFSMFFGLLKLNTVRNA